MSKSLDAALGSQLLARIAARDETALHQLQKVFGRRIYAFALNRLHDEAEADEVTGDTLFEVWRCAERFRGESQASTWILGIARNKILTRLRDRAPSNEELDETRPDEGPSAFDHVLQVQAREHLKSCLEKLSAEQSECVILVHHDGFSLEEVVAVQGCPKNTVKTRLFYARQNLKQCLQKVKDML